MRGPGPRSYVPSMGTQALTAFRFSKITARSTARSRTIGNFEKGSRRIGCSRLSMSAEHAMRARPLISMAHDPQTSSRQFESYVIGVVALPSRVTGLAAISISTEMTFMFGLWGMENSSQYDAEVGVGCRLILMMTDFELAMIRFCWCAQVELGHFVFFSETTKPLIPPNRQEHKHANRNPA